jgi:hypothetical protein
MLTRTLPFNGIVVVCRVVVHRIMSAYIRRDPGCFEGALLEQRPSSGTPGSCMDDARDA